MRSLSYEAAKLEKHQPWNKTADLVKFSKV